MYIYIYICTFVIKKKMIMIIKISAIFFMDSIATFFLPFIIYYFKLIIFLNIDFFFSKYNGNVFFCGLFLISKLVSHKKIRMLKTHCSIKPG